MSAVEPHQENAFPIMRTIKQLVETLGVRPEETRVLGRDIIAIAGPIGGVFSDLEMRLALSRLSPSARDAAQELVDYGVVEVNDAGRLFVARMPTGDEIRLVRVALGLQHRRAA